jgi:PII-like signaling protein
MKLTEEGCLLRIFIGERDRYEHWPLYEWIVKKAHESGLAGATVLRGMMGFGANSRIKSSKILRLSDDLPIIVELVDTKENLKEFLSLIDHAIGEGLATYEKANILFYRSRES